MVCSVLIWMGRPKWWFSVGGGDRFISQVHRTRSSLWYRFTWQAKQSYSLKGVERILNCVISPCRPALDQDLQPSSGNGGHKSPESVMAGYTPQQKPLRIWRTTRRVSLPQEYIYPDSDQMHILGKLLSLRLKILYTKRLSKSTWF